jgi:hypothetical protein
MNDTNHSDDWSALCELAANENDPRKLLDLITKINRALEECHQHKREQTSHKVDTAFLAGRQSELLSIAAAFPGNC